MEEEKKISTEETENDIKSTEMKDTLEALLFNDDIEADESDYYQAEIEFDAFMSEYRDLISKSLADASATRNSEKLEGQEVFPIPLPKKQEKKSTKFALKSEEEKADWDDDITLEPIEYDDLTENDEPAEDIPTEIEDEDEVFDLGEQTEDTEDNFQISINFDSEQTPALVAEDPKERKYDPDKPRFMDWVFDIAEMFVFVLVAVVILTAFVFRHSIVEGNSMNNTLQDGDHLIISDLFYTPERGDIVVFEDYSTFLKKAVVKRVIGLPGETVEIRLDSEGTVLVYINGVQLDEKYAFNACDANLDTSNYNKPITLGDDEIFVMGDNRYHSTDSRISGVGPIKIDAILGKVVLRFMPFDKFGTVE